MDAEPPPYCARIHPATKEVIERHIATINRLLQEGKALQEDVDNFNILLDVYDILPHRPNTQPQRENWDSLDPMAPLGLPVCGELNVAGDDARLLVVAGGVRGQRRPAPPALLAGVALTGVLITKNLAGLASLSSYHHRSASLLPRTTLGNGRVLVRTGRLVSALPDDTHSSGAASKSWKRSSASGAPSFSV